jgi:hypothetical protein
MNESCATSTPPARAVTRTQCESCSPRRSSGARPTVAPTTPATITVGDHVAEPLAKFVEITDGTFELEPREFVSTADHVAASVRWRADRGGVHVEGTDLAVFRIVDGWIAGAWFLPGRLRPAGARAGVLVRAERVSTIEQRLAELGLRLPAPMAPPPGAEFPFALVRISGGHAHASGHGPADGSTYLMQRSARR